MDLGRDLEHGCPVAGCAVRKSDEFGHSFTNFRVDTIGSNHAWRRGMSRESPRFIPAGSLVEITAMTVAGRFWLVPSERLNAGIRSILGRALARYPVDLHAISFMSNHWHALVSVLDAEALSRFVQYMHANIATLVHRLRGADGKIFAKASYIIVGPSAEEDRLCYVMAQGVKEGLVRRCLEWPGVNSTPSLLLEKPLVGRHDDRCYPIDFVPLPSWRHLNGGERRIRIKRIADDIEMRARTEHPHVLGVKGVLTTVPGSKPAVRKRTPAAPIHTTDKEERIGYTTSHAHFNAMFVDARARLRKKHLATLPLHCFPPITPFCRQPTVVWAFAPPEQARPPTAESKHQTTHS